MKFKSIFKILFRIFDTFVRFMGLLFIGILILAGYYANWVWKQIPTPEQMRGCTVTTMYKVELCPGSANYVRIEDISPYLIKSIVLTEDSKFWDHKGFDIESIEKNAQEAIETGRYKRGGSTISQQLVKNVWLSGEKTLVRKGIEALITFRMEKTLSKKEILERYLNVIEFGQDIFGVKAASQFYFRKQAKDLNVLESAFLAMLLPNPQKYGRSFFKKELTPFARNRVEKIVSDLFQYNRIQESEYKSALVQIDSFIKGGSLLVLPEFQNIETKEIEQSDSSAGLPEEE